MKQKTPPTRCAIYTRTATAAAGARDLGSVRDQRTRAQDFIGERRGKGWAVHPERYDDPGCSGATMERPALLRLLADARAGVFQVVVVFAVDRLTRRLGDFSRIVEMLREAGVSLLSVTQPLDGLLDGRARVERGRP